MTRSNSTSIRWRYLTDRRETAIEEMQAFATREGVAPAIASMAQSLLAGMVSGR